MLFRSKGGMGRVLWASLFLFLTLVERCQEEIPLPKVLALHNNELHLHGPYRAPLAEKSEIKFVLSVPSYFRFYMAEHDVVDMDVELLDSQSSLLDLSMAVGGEEMMSQKLASGSYTIVFTPFVVDEEVDRNNLCESLDLEIAISPVTVADTRVAKLPNFGPTFIPPLSSQTIDSYLSHGTAFAYDSTSDQSSELFNVAINKTDFGFMPKFLAHWSFDLIPQPGTNPLFDFEAILGYNFLTSGNLRLLLDNSNDTSGYPPCEIALDVDGECKRGRNLIENAYVVQTKLGPGSYTLWLFEMPDRRVTEVTNHPFSFKLNIQQMHGAETFLSCPVLSLPPTLVAPGLIDSTGYLHFREDILIDLAQQEQRTSFSVNSEFLMRIWTEPHRVDIDIIFRKVNGTTIVRTFRTLGHSESIIVKGEANEEYEIVFKFYGRYDAVFCESFLLELLIQPVTPLYTFDYCSLASNTSKPVLSSLDRVSEKVTLPRTEYRYTWDPERRHDDVIISVPIITTKDMILKVNVESHFFAGLDLIVITNSNSTRRATHASTYRGGLKLSHILSAGLNHTFVLRGGPHSGVGPDVSFFPSCAFFSFEFSLSPVEIFAPILRCPTNRLPLQLDSPSYFGSSNRVHYQALLTVPPVLAPFETEDSMQFSVRTRSLFRAYTESRVLNGHDLDIDFMLIEDGVPVEHEVKEEGEEKITYILNPGKHYVFKTVFFADFSKLPPCVDWNIEWEVAPVDGLAPSGPCTTILPSSDTIFIRNLRSEWTLSETYAFSQSDEALLLRIPIVVENDDSTVDVIYFRSVVFYNFVWSDLFIRLLDSNEDVVTMGQNAFDKNEILSIQLTSGNYTLEIFEPEALETVELHHCSQFALFLGVAPHFANQIQIEIEEQEECPFVGSFHSWNNPSALSVLSDNTFHDARSFKKTGVSLFFLS